MKWEPFYGGSRHAVTASKTQMIEHAAEMQGVLGDSLQIVAVNKLYRNCCICRTEGRLHHFTVIGDRARQEHEFRESWEAAPNYVRMEELETGQMELF